MTSERVRQLFDQTLSGEYEDKAPWDAVTELRRNGCREIFEIAAGWLDASEPKQRARGAAILAQLRLPPETPQAKPTWVYRDEAFDLITTMLKRENDPMVLDSAISALGHISDPSAIPIIVPYAKHADSNVRFSVAFSLGSFANDAKAIEYLLDLVRDEDADVRDWAVFGLGVQGSADSAQIREALLERTNDIDEDVREEALVGLGKRRDVRLLPILRPLLDSPELKYRVAEAASAMLGLSYDPEEWESEDYKRALNETFGAPTSDVDRNAL